MAEPSVPRRPSAPVLFRVTQPEDLQHLPFRGGITAVEMPVEFLRHVDLKNDHRGDSARLRALKRSIRRKGFRPVEPIIARVGRKGRWVIVDGGHRLTAVQQIMAEWWTALFGARITSLYFVLFTTEDSWSKVDPPEHMKAEQIDHSLLPLIQAAWDRAGQRARSMELKESAAPSN